MPKINGELRKHMKEWMREKAITCQEPTILANLASAWFHLYYNPKWLDVMAEEVISEEQNRMKEDEGEACSDGA